MSLRRAFARTALSRHLCAARLLLAVGASPREDGSLRVEEGIVASGGVDVPIVRYESLAGPDEPGLVLVHGVHHLGMHDPRLVAFARALAGAGFRVMTPEMASLRAFRIDESGARLIGDAAQAQAAHTRASRVAVVGISFAGGLSLVAASTPHNSRAIGAVASIGGHADLARVSRFLLSPTGNGTGIIPHPYGSRVLALRYVDSLVAPVDAASAREALLAWLSDDFARAEALAKRVSPASRATLEELVAQEFPARAVLRIERAAAADHAAQTASSPLTRMDRVRVPVFLLHGVDDAIIPANEMRALAERTPARTLSAALITPVLGHSELSSAPTLLERLKVVRFVAALLGAAGALAGG